MRPPNEPHAAICPFLRSIREHQSGATSNSYTNACYLQRHPTRTNLVHALHTQANLCMSPDHVICPHYRIAMRTRRSPARVPISA